MLRHARRVLTAIVVLALSLGFALPALSASALASLPAKPPTKSDLAALRAEAEQAAASLAAGTAALEKVQLRAADLAKRAKDATRRSAVLDAQLGALHVQLGAVAAAAYRNPLGNTAELLMGGQGQTVGQTLQGLSYLDVVAARRASVLRLAANTRVLAEQTRREAAQLAGDAAAAAADAAHRVVALKQQAADVGAKLTKAMAAYNAEQARLHRLAVLRELARQRALARERASRSVHFVVHSGPCAGGGGRAWGGYPNGFIPDSALSPITHAPGHRLRCDAASAFDAMSAAYAAAHGGNWLCVTDSYRSYAEQQRLYQEKPTLAAVPGTSNHGWALAVDLCGGAERAGSDADQWLHANAHRFGWQHPGWAEPNGSKPEAWHWEFGNIS